MFPSESKRTCSYTCGGMVDSIILQCLVTTLNADTIGFVLLSSSLLE